MTAPKTSTSTAIQKVESAAPGALTVGQRKAFLEVAERTDLDKLSNDQQRAALVAFSMHTGLRPEHGEVMIYQGRFYVTMAGRVRNAHKNGLFDGVKARPASTKEKVEAGYEETDLVWITDVFRKGSREPFRGWGKVTREEINKARAGERTKHTPVAKHPVEMARKRSEYDGLRIAFPLDEDLNAVATRYIIEAEEAIKRIAPLTESQDDVEEKTAAGEVTDGAAPGGQSDLELDQQIAGTES